MLELKDILTSVINNSGQRLAQEKLAQDMSKKTNESKGIAAQAKREKNEEDVNMGAEKTAFEYVEKVASAVEYVVDNFNDILPKGPLARALDKVANTPGAGAGSLEVSKSGKPHADYAKKDKMSETEDPSTPKTKPGAQGKTKDTLDTRPGGPLLKKEPFINSPSGSSKEAALAVVLNKLAGEDVMKAHIKASSSKNPGASETWEANQSPGTPMGHDQSGYGNQNEKHIMTNQGAIDMTKRDAKKAYVKEQLGQVFDEANPEKDTTLDRAWTRGRDTAKMANDQGQSDAEKHKSYGNKGLAAGTAVGALGAGGMLAAHKAAPGMFSNGQALGLAGASLGSNALMGYTAGRAAASTPEQIAANGHHGGTGAAIGGLAGAGSGLAGARMMGLGAKGQAGLAAANGLLGAGGGYLMGKQVAQVPDAQKVAEAVEQGCQCDGEGSCSYCKAKSAVMKKLAAFKRAGMEGPAAGGVPGGEDPGVAAQAGAGGPPPPGGPQAPPPPDCQCGGQGQCLPCKKQQLALIMAQAKAQGGPGGAPAPGGPGGDPGAGGLPPEQPQAM